MSFGISIGDLIKLGEIAARVYKNCRDCTGEYKSLTNETRSLTNLLDDIQDKFGKIPSHKRQQLVDAYNPCIDVLYELDKLLVHYINLDTKSKRTWDRLAWDPEKTRTLRERLASSVTMLNAFYTSLIHDNQVLILEALERLEGDYKGGHREESIASIERIASQPGQVEEHDENLDAAWTQIIRDLEDVGISHEIASKHREFVIDWFIGAVNEGRLLEERADGEQTDSKRPLQSNNFSDLEFSAERSTMPSTSTKSDAFCAKDQTTSIPASLIVPLQRSNSSDAPEPLHIQSHLTDASEVFHFPNTFHQAPEPVQLVSPADLAPEPVSRPEYIHTSESQNRMPDQMQSTVLASEAPELVQSSATIDLDWRAHQILAAWIRCDFVTASKLLEEQLASVEEGAVSSTGLQPDRRILRHCIGACASFSGNYTKAKYFFESAFNGIYLKKDLDDGDIAAARWLGDACLQLREFHNAVLAWSVALEGSIKRYGSSHENTRLIVKELLKMDEWVSVFRSINSRFEANVDPTDIFHDTHALEKSNLVHATQSRIKEQHPKWSQLRTHRPTTELKFRPRINLVPGEAFWTGPLVSLGAWPLQWDHTFSPMASYQIEWFLRVAQPSMALAQRGLRTNTLGDSKKLDYVTKCGSIWLIENTKAILREMGLEHVEHPDENSILCCLNKDRGGYACTEVVFISFWKLQFRNVCGLRISNVMWSTRKPPRSVNSHHVLEYMPPVDTIEFKDTFKEMLELADTGSKSQVPVRRETTAQSSSRSWSSWATFKKIST